MLFNPDIHKEEDKEAILDVQMGGWLIESHCWGKPDKNDIQTCEWCGMTKTLFFNANQHYPFCEGNPILKKLKEE